MKRRHADAEQAAAVEELAALTPRQREVLTLVCKGYQSAEIAGMMCITPKTVDITRSAIMRTLEMTLIEAAVLAAKAGWV